MPLRHPGPRPLAHELADLAADRPPLLVEHVHVLAERRKAHGARLRRREHRHRQEAGADLGSARAVHDRDAAPPAHVRVEPVVRPAVPRLAGRDDAAEGGQIAVGITVGEQCPDESRRNAEHRHPLVLDGAPDAIVRSVGCTLQEHDGRTARHRADHRPWPHDPAHVRREEDAVARAEVGLVRRLPCDREQESALHVERALRAAGRARRVGEEVRRLALDLDGLERAGPALDRARATRRRGPGSIAQSPAPRCQTTTRSTLGASASASSRTSFIGTSRPRRYDASAVTTTFAPASASRADTAGPANPEKIGT